MVKTFVLYCFIFQRLRYHFNGAEPFVITKIETRGNNIKHSLTSCSNLNLLRYQTTVHTYTDIFQYKVYTKPYKYRITDNRISFQLRPYYIYSQGMIIVSTLNMI